MLKVFALLLFIAVSVSPVLAYDSKSSFTVTVMVDMDVLYNLPQSDVFSAPDPNVLRLYVVPGIPLAVSVLGGEKEWDFYGSYTGKHLWSLSYDAVTKDVQLSIDGKYIPATYVEGVPSNSFSFTESDLIVDTRVASSLHVTSGVMSSQQLLDLYQSFFTTPLSCIYLKGKNVLIMVELVGSFLVSLVVIGGLVSGFNYIRRFI